MGNELIISIGRQLNIPGKVDNEWMCRVIYSIAGQMGLASLWDYTPVLTQSVPAPIQKMG